MTQELRELKKNTFSRRAALGFFFSSSALLITGCAEAVFELDAVAYRRNPENRISLARLVEKQEKHKDEKIKRDKVFRDAQRRQRHAAIDFRRKTDFEGSGGGGGGGDGH